MNKFLTLFLIIAIAACNPAEESKKMQEAPKQDNAELSALYAADQGDRQTTEINWLEVSTRDSLRRVRVHQLLDSNKVITSKDYQNAAMIFQHGKDSVDYGMAVKLMEKSIELDSAGNKWLLAAATDRYLLSKGEPQIYGTQYHKRGDEPWVLAEIDTTKITDEERIEFGVETLAGQRERVKQMNKKNLIELYTSGESIDSIKEIIRNENSGNSEYDVSEGGVNNFGYYLLSQEKNEEAASIFKLNTELYPTSFNTYDSYGEGLLKIGDKENAKAAYEKSLALNPNNDNAKKVLGTIQVNN